MSGSRAEIMLSGLKRGDPPHQHEFFNTYWQRLFQLCLRATADQWLSQDIATEVMGDFLCRYVQGLKHPSAMWSYLKLMAMQRLGRQSRRPKTVPIDTDSLESDASQDQEEWAWKRELGPVLGECLEGLSPKSRKVLKLRYQLDLSFEQIGNMVGGSRQYIGRLVHSCQEKLKKCIEKKLQNRLAEDDQGRG